MLPRKRRTPSRCEVGTSEPQHPSTARDYYRGLYSEALDCLTCSIKERFNQAAFLVYKKHDEARVTCDAKSLNVHERDLIGQVARISVSWHTLILPPVQQESVRFQPLDEWKTCLRSQMHQARCTHLSILNTHKTRLDGICPVPVTNAFVYLNDNR